MQRSTFVITWYGWDTSTIATEEIERYDLTDAITAACNQLKACKGNAASAHGFFVKVKR